MHTLSPWFSQHRHCLTSHHPTQTSQLGYPKPTTLLRDKPSLAPSSGASSTSGASDGASTVSGLSAPTALVTTGTGQLTRGKGAWIANLNQDPDLQSIVDSSIKLHDLIGWDMPPVLDNGSQVCLSYHVRCGCWSTCGRAYTHGLTLTPGEKTWVLQYLQVQHQKLQRTLAASQASGATSSPHQA